MNHHESQAAAAYKRKDYDTALQLYSRAIGRAESAKLYDARAACHVKLKDTSAALKDAKKCIQIAKTDPVGYIRAGKVLVAMDKKNDALQVMAYGLRTVKHAGQSYETLKSAHNALMDEINRPLRSVDPLTVLPRELAIYVLQYLDFRQRVRLIPVSKAWSVFIKSVPELWEHLDVSRASPHIRQRVKHTFVIQAIKASRWNIKQATLNNMAKTEDAIELLVRHCPLESLTLLAVPRLGDNFAQMLQPAKHLKSLHFSMDEEERYLMIRHIFEVLGKQLEDFSCRMAPIAYLSHLIDELTLSKMKRLNMICNIGPGLSSMPCLQALTLRNSNRNLSSVNDSHYDLEAFHQLQHIDIVCGQLNFCNMKLPASLKTLKVKCFRAGNETVVQYDTAGWPNLALPELQELHLDMAFVTPLHMLSPSLFQSELQVSSLERLTVSRVMLLYETIGLQEFESFCSHPRLRNLQHIGWPECMNWDDDLVPILVKKLPNLSSMELSSTTVTGVGVQAALNAVHMRELILNDCPRLGQDAVQWARSKGVRIQNRKTEALGHERSLRN